MAVTVAHAPDADADTDRHIARWRPLVQVFLAIPQLFVTRVLSSLRSILTFVSFFTVLFTETIPRPLFDAIVMTYRYEWRTVSYVALLHEKYPPFDFTPASDDTGVDPHTTLSIDYPEQLNRWKPLYKWFLAIPQYIVCFALAIASLFVVLWAFIVVLVTGQYPEGPRDFLVNAYRYGLRVQAYAGLLTDEYPPYRMAA